MKDEILYHPSINFVILLIGLSLCGAWWGVASQAGETVAMMSLGPVPYSNPLDGFGLGDLWSMVWNGLRIMFWILFGLAGTFIILVVLASLGVLTWVIQQLAKGFWYVGSSIRKNIESIGKEAPVIAKTPEGKTLDTKQILTNHEVRITALEAKQNVEL